MNWKTEGFTEAGISVRDLDAWIQFLVAVGGWEVLHQGETPAATRAAWPGQASTRVLEALLGRPGSPAGHIRLFQFETSGQMEIRGGAMPRDTGGIFDLDIRVANMDDCRRELTARGWTDLSGPVEWPFGEVRIIEWLARGPEAVVLALVQRLQPPLPAGNVGPGLGPVFNSSQIVHDVDRSVHFYQQLGFQLAINHRGPLEGRGGEVLGLTADEAPDTHVDLVIMHPDAVMNGSIELVALPTRPGRDLAQHALPHQLGLNLLRFPVAGIEAFARHVETSGLVREPVVFRTELEPYGPVRQMNLRSPDGAWLEFYEKTA